MATETDLRKPLIAALRKCNAIVVPYVGSTFGYAGTADVFIAHKYWQGWIEFKGPNTDIEDDQFQFREDMRARGVSAHILRLFPDNWAIFCHSVGGEFRWSKGIDLIKRIAEEDVIVANNT